MTQPLPKRRPGRPKLSDNALYSAKNQILDAAERVVVANGPYRLTLDAVTKEANISKGGLLYHFATKEKLIDGMIERYLDNSVQRELKVAAQIGGINNDIRAIISEMTNSRGDTDRLGAALLAAAAIDLDRLEPVRKALCERFESFKRREIRFEICAATDLAVIGLTLLELLKIPPLFGHDRERVLLFLDAMARGAFAESLD